MENAVFLKLRKHNDELFYFLNENECYFIVKSDGKFQAVQVCYYLDENNRGREIKGLVECCKYINLKKGLLLTNSQEDSIKENGIDIVILPVWKWLLKK